MKTLIGLLMMASASVASADLIPFDQFLGFQDVERGVPQIICCLGLVHYSCQAFGTTRDINASRVPDLRSEAAVVSVS